MELRGIKNKNTLIGLEKPEISGFSEENMLDVVGQERIASLKKAIQEIKQLVDERKRLSLEFIKDAEDIKSEINNLLIGNESTLRALGHNEFLIEKNNLRNKKVEISELQLNEKINCWKDIALLKKELRIYEKELSEKEGRMREINDLLSEGED